uniref:Ig-like domain-containing protein n=1 Tax=Sus scrofa TaxID=9823 RepID=A0A8D0S568_PIG
MKDQLNVTKSNSLQLNNLTVADPRSYVAQIATTSLVFYSYDLRIFKRLPRPQVRVDSLPCEHNTCNITLRCSVEEGGESIIYEWTPMGLRAILSQEGSVLRDSWNTCDLNWTYTCTAMNPVGNSTLSLNLWELCAKEHSAKPFIYILHTLHQFLLLSLTPCRPASVSLITVFNNYFMLYVYSVWF